MFGRRNTKKTLVDIEMDADSDLEEFEHNNQIEKIRDDDSDDDLDEATEFGRQATQIDKKPGSLQSDSELARQDLNNSLKDQLEGRPLDLRREDTEIEKMPADHMPVAQQSEGPGQTQRTMKMSIMINQEPMTHDYADVDQHQKQNPKAKNFKRTFVDQSNFSYFNTIMDEDLAQRKLLKRKQNQ